MSDWTKKTRHVGPPVKDLRKVDQDPVKVPPHKKERKWKLTVEWTETTTWRRECEFTSRAARDEARRRIERHFREVVEKEKAKQPRKFVSWLDRSPFSNFDDIKVTKLKSEPEYTESNE